MDRGLSNPHLHDLLDVGRRFGQLTRLGSLRNDRNWPFASCGLERVVCRFRGLADLARPATARPGRE